MSLLVFRLFCTFFPSFVCNPTYGHLSEINLADGWMDGWKGDKEKKSFDVPKQRRLKSGVSPASELPARRKMEDRRGATSSREEEGDGSELDSSMQKQHRQQRGGNTDVLRQTPLD